jgi:DNA end-binding protein Ku
MAPRSIWNGTLAFGALAVPVKLFSAVENRGIRFREVRLSDGCPIKHRRVGAESGEEIPAEQIAKAYETSRGRQVVLEDSEIAAARGPRPKVIDIEHFVHSAEIDLAYHDRPYILGAQPGGERAYRVLAAALERAELVGIGRFVLRTREQLVSLRPRGQALMVYTMHFADEIVGRSDLEVPELRREPSKKESAMAQQLIETLSEDWDAPAHKDHYREAVLELIERKGAGEELPRPSLEPTATPDDLLAALEKSLERRPTNRPAKRRSDHPREQERAGPRPTARTRSRR